MTNLSNLEKFCADYDVNAVNNYISTNKNKFNIFKVLKLDNHEIRHSNFLAWLLNPKENHNLRDEFLQDFLKQAINYNVPATDDLIVNTEYFTNKSRRIDILLHSKKSDFVCVIENKYGSNEHDEQCKHYKEFIENYSKFKDYKNKYYIFLDIEKPDNEQLQNALYCYEPITYRQVYKILAELLKKHNNLPQEVKQAMEQYKCIIMEKYSMVDEITKSKCREIYSKYHDVIDTLEQYKSELQQDVYSIMESILDDKNITNADINGKGYNDKTGCGIRFVPVEYSQDSSILKLNKITKYSKFFSLEYKNNLKLGIYEIKFNEQWITHDSIEWDIWDKSDDEIKESIFENVNNLKNEYEALVKKS